MAFGVAVGVREPGVCLAVAVYFLAFYPSVMAERRRAFPREKFPEEHAAWAAAVPLFWPRLTPGWPALLALRPGTRGDEPGVADSRGAAAPGAVFLRPPARPPRPRLTGRVK